MAPRHNATKTPAVRHKIVAPNSHPPTPPQDPRGVVVVVLKDGIYNNPRHKSLGPCKAGAQIEVAAGAYGDSLIADGFVSLPGTEPAEEQVEE
jgi:hypothetical protein